MNWNKILLVLFLSMTISLGNTFDRLSNCNILSLSGGGSFGAVEVGILESIHSTWNITNYDLIAGVSVGALNALYLSYQDDINNGISDLKTIYEDLNNHDVYKINYKFSLFNIDRISFFDTTPLKNTLTEILKNYDENKIQTVIGSTNLNTGRFDMFRMNEYSKDDKINLLMTSSAIPFAFPPAKFNNSLYVDGGLISDGIINGIESLIDCKHYNVTYITSHNQLGFYGNIKNIFHYTKRVLEIVYEEFDDQIVEIRNLICDKNNSKREIININYCYPDYTGLSNYSILDFTKGEELIEIGRNNHVCENINLCKF